MNRRHLVMLWLGLLGAALIVLELCSFMSSELRNEAASWTWMHRILGSLICVPSALLLAGLIVKRILGDRAKAPPALLLEMLLLVLVGAALIDPTGMGTLGLGVVAAGVILRPGSIDRTTPPASADESAPPGP